MDQNILVTVIIIFFNEEKFIEESIQSVLSQTYRNWELLLTDDGSDDNSTEIAKNYAKEYPNKIKYLEHENHSNKGMSASRNSGIKVSNGDYITFLDADDVWYEYTLEEFVKIIKKYPEAGMVYGKYQLWYSWADEIKDNGEDAVKPDLEKVLSPNKLYEPPYLLLCHLKNRERILIPGVCSLVVKKSSVEKLGGFVDYFTGLHEDQILMTKVFLNEKVYITDKCFARYRQHKDSSCYEEFSSGSFIFSRLMYYTWMEMYLVDNGYFGTEIWDALMDKTEKTRSVLLSNYTLISEKVNALKEKQTKVIQKYEDKIANLNSEISNYKREIKQLKEKRFIYTDNKLNLFKRFRIKIELLKQYFINSNK